MQICFILVNPAVPGNVGATARAMKTMGFSDLRLVNPCDHHSLEARMLAHGSTGVLENAVVFKSLPDALYDIDFVVGTTARRRSLHNLYLPVEKLPDLITAKGESAGRTAIVFGSEESGLSNEHTHFCHILTSISLATKHPSLNLAQAVMIYAYNLSVLSGKKSHRKGELNNPDTWQALRTRIELILDKIDLTEADISRHKIMERIALLEEKDIKLLHSITSRLIRKL